MGIEKFHKWLYNRYKNCFEDIKKSSFNYVYIDINCILHRVVNGSINEKMLFKKFYSHINNILKFNVPTKKLILAIDGVAPFAKIILQRKRRLKISRNISSKNINRKSGIINVVNPLHFTPGTKFMKLLPEKINKFLKKIESTYKIKTEILNGSGEAEFKIVNSLTKISKNNDRHLLVSTDADIILIACSVTNNITKNIYINNFKYIISIDKLLQLHKQKVGISSNSNKDFMLISLLMGNDYLPKLNYVNPDKLWDAYISALKNDNKGCFINNNFNYDFLLNLFRALIVQIPKQWISQFNVYNYSEDMYKNYIEGLVWCSEVYTNSLCEQTEYMYKYNYSPHPFGLLFYLESNIKTLKTEQTNTPILKLIIPEDIYAILVLPKSSLHLVDNKYSKKIDESLNFLYDEEMCKDCIKYHKMLDSYHTELQNDPDNVDKIKEIKKIMKETSLVMIKHKNIHKNISISEINHVIKYLS